jgi:hypothetical protein
LDNDRHTRARRKLVKTLREKLEDGVTAAFSQYASYEDARQAGIINIAADAALSALCQWLADEGLVVVPRLPSWEMLEAGHVSLVVDPWDATSAPWVGAAWECMISAAPDALETKL